ncbi:unnamed protein product [Parajaminaea phylloscopi]
MMDPSVRRPAHVDMLPSPPGVGPPVSPAQASCRNVSSQASFKQRGPKSTSPSLPIDHDFVVQAANPSHPQHRQWLEAYGVNVLTNGGSTSRRRRGDALRAATSDATLSRRKGSRDCLVEENTGKPLLVGPYSPRDNSLSSRGEATTGARSLVSRAPALGTPADGQHISTQGEVSSSSSSSSALSADEDTSRFAHSFQKSRSRGTTAPTKIRNNDLSSPRPLPSPTAPPLSSALTPPRNGNRVKRDRKKIRARQTVKERSRMPTPPLPPPRISSTANYQPLTNEPNEPAQTADLQSFHMPETNEVHRPHGHTFDDALVSTYGAGASGSPVQFPLDSADPQHSARSQGSPTTRQRSVPSPATSSHAAGPLHRVLAETSEKVRGPTPPLPRFDQSDLAGSVSSPTSTRFDHSASSQSHYPTSGSHRTQREASSDQRGSGSATNDSAYTTAGSRTASLSVSSPANATLELAASAHAPATQGTGLSTKHRGADPAGSADLHHNDDQPRLPDMEQTPRPDMMQSYSMQGSGSLSSFRERNNLSAVRTEERSRTREPQDDATATGTSTPTRIRASFDDVGRRFLLTGRRTGGAAAADAVEDATGVSEASTPDRPPAVSRPKLKSLLSTLKLSPGKDGSRESVRSGNLTSGPNSPSRVPKKARDAESLPPRPLLDYPSRGTQSMDIPRHRASGVSPWSPSSPAPPVPRLVTRKPVPAAPQAISSLEDHVLTPSVSLAPAVSGQRLSQVGEEAEEIAEAPPLPQKPHISEHSWSVDRAPPPLDPHIKALSSQNRSFSTPLPSKAFDATDGHGTTDSPEVTVESTPASRKAPAELPRAPSRVSLRSTFSRMVDGSHFGDAHAGAPPLPSSTSQSTTEAPMTPGRRSRLASIWSRTSGRKDKPESPMPSSHSRLDSQSHHASSSMSHGLSSSSIITHSLSESVEASSPLTVEPSAPLPLGLGIVTTDGSEAMSFNDQHHPDVVAEKQTRSRWRSRVPSLTSLKSGRKTRTQQGTSSPTPPLPTLPSNESDPPLPRDFSVPYPELRDSDRAAAQDFDGNQEDPHDNEISWASAGPSTKARTFRETVVAVGRKSFSRDRARDISHGSRLEPPVQELPTIHKSLSPALLSEHAKFESSGRPFSADFFPSDSDEPDDLMDDERARNPLTQRSRPSGSQANMGVRGQDANLQDAPDDAEYGPRAMSVSSYPFGDTDLPRASHAEAPAQPPVAASGISTQSFLDRRASLGKTHVTPPSLNLSPPAEVLATPPLDGDESVDGDGNLRAAPSPSPSMSLRSPSSAGRRTPRSVKALWSTATGASPAFSSPGRTSFSMDRDRAPVASPFIPSNVPSSPRGVSIRGALKKIVTAGALTSNRYHTPSPQGRGISSEQLRAAADRYPTSETGDEEREELALGDHGQYAGSREADSLASRTSLSSFRDPWDGGLAAAEAATRMLEVESRTMMPSPSSSPLWPRTPTAQTPVGPRTPSESHMPDTRGLAGSLGAARADGEVAPSSCPATIDGDSSFLPMARTRKMSFGANKSAFTPGGSRGTTVTSGFAGRGSSGYLPSSRPQTLRSVSGSTTSSPTGGIASTASFDSSLNSTHGAGPGAFNNKTSELNALDALLRQQKARESETLRNISERNRTPKLT